MRMTTDRSAALALLHSRDGLALRSSAIFPSGSVGQLSKPNLDTRKMYKRLEEREHFLTKVLAHF